MVASCLLVIDVQNDFCPGGALEVPRGDEVVPVCNAMMEHFDHVVLTQDWHPAGHTSFASSHPGRDPYDSVELAYGTQVLWPDHCVQGSTGADFHPHLDTHAASLVVRKGYRRRIDSYSAFFENDKQTTTGLHGYLQALGITTVHLVGLALDFCVAYSAIDAANLGYKVTVMQDGTRAIDLDGSLAASIQQMDSAGVTIV